MRQREQCPACGEAIGADARFCRHCGASQAASVPAPAAVSVESRAHSVADRAAPEATDFAAALTAQLRTPAVVAAVLAGAVAFALVLAAGFIVAAATPASSIIGGFGDGSLVDEWLIQTCALVGAPLQITGSGAGALGFDIAFQTMPALGVVIPVAAVAVTVRRLQLPRIRGLGPEARVGWTVAAVLSFALLMLVPALIGELSGDDAPFKAEAGSTFGLSVLWGVVGALIGARADIARLLENVGARRPRLQAFAGPPVAALRALVLALAASAAVVLIAVVAQTISEPSVRGDRPVGGAAVENSLYVVEHGVHGVQLGTLAAFELPKIVAFGEDSFSEGDSGPTGGLLMPIPESVRPVVGADLSDGYRIFDYADAMHTYKFVPLLVVLIGIPVLFALYGGFFAARAAHASNKASAVIWGAIVGPVWAMAMLALGAITKGTDLLSIFGHADGGSAFGWSLLIATAAGAAGGLLAGASLPAVASGVSARATSE